MYINMNKERVAIYWFPSLWLPGAPLTSCDRILRNYGQLSELEPALQSPIFYLSLCEEKNRKWKIYDEIIYF